ncbi:hypothetical protein WG66_013709 [Moniliophthora roreri]|nr:hypothetical protein WG66_013709 [Moniliophthora roreri]
MDVLNERRSRPTNTASVYKLITPPCPANSVVLRFPAGSFIPGHVSNCHVMMSIDAVVDEIGRSTLLIRPW